MRLKDGAHLTYSTAVHPGETWSEIRAQLVSHAPAVKRLISPDQPFGMGLRLSAAAARSLAEPRRFAEFQEFLEGHGLYVFTMSGGPYGSCHEPRIKDGVYLPDWQDERRLDFADRLAWLLSRLLPEDVAEGTITTIPGAFKGHVPSPGAIEDMADRMIRHVATLFRLCQETGRCIVLAIEPEPCCLLETVEETISFFQNHLFAGAPRLARLLGISWPAAEIVLRRHLGLCLDACHVALQFEEPLPAVLRLRAAGIRIVKVQISAGLRLTRLTPAALAALGSFVHDMELHQVVEQGTAGLWRHADLTQALQTATDSAAREWRVHFHVPVWPECLGVFESTQPFLRDILTLHKAEAIAPHLEVETYNWELLPAPFRARELSGDVARELSWVLEVLGGLPAP